MAWRIQVLLVPYSAILLRLGSGGHCSQVLDAYPIEKPSALILCLDKGHHMGYSRRKPPKPFLVCKECREEKPAEAFYLHSKGEGWRRQPCKACISLRHRQPPRPKPTEKRCNACGETKALAKFSLVGPLNHPWPRSRMSICTLCHNRQTQERHKKQREADPEAYAAQLLTWSRQWRENNPDKARASTDRYRARKNSAPYIEDVSLDVLYERDKGICQLCFKTCKRTDASGDHIIPVSLGGETSYRNMVLAHKRCNSGKRDRPVPQQMRLIG